MQKIPDGLLPILEYLLEQRGLDFSGCRPAMLERRISLRLSATLCRDYAEYLVFIKNSSEEADKLLSAITINVSRFFRDPLTFELLAGRILPAIIQEKIRDQDRSLRIWSAGCATGEEPYSVAILINELLEKDQLAMNLHIFATDIDERILADATRATYSRDSIGNVQTRLIDKYFSPAGENFSIVPSIKNQVSFSSYDMLDKKHRVPPASIFGGFDLVLCRNLLIYFNSDYQEIIFAKLHNALAAKGYLVLGDTEAPSIAYQKHFSRLLNFSPIYRKI
ncbi:MAG: protein-glutamate O-methyltransferase CheR [Desulforhopalus sp.]|nr:protein-glutamate O-methyltransferase CheR [Desulforhopalus sp.]